MRISDWSSDVCSSDLAAGVLAPIVGHVGDGNFHLTFLIDPDDAEEMARAEGVNERMVMRALAMGGTCTGEHGVGTGKMRFLRAEHGDALAVMRQVKQALDPDNIMNPGKIRSEEHTSELQSLMRISYAVFCLKK